MRTGQAISIDFAAAMVIFLFMITAGVFLFQDSVVPEGGFASQMEAAGLAAFEQFTEQTSWTLQRVPVTVHASGPMPGEPVVIEFPYPQDIVRNSVVVTRNGNEIVSQHNFSTNETIFVADMNAGVNRFNVLYTRDVSVDDRNYVNDTTLDAHQSSLWNADLNLTFLSSGLSRLRYKDLSMLQDDADLGASSSPTIRTQPLRGNATYDEAERKTVQIFDGSGEIHIRQWFTGEATWQFNLTDNFTELYGAAADSTYDLDRSGTIYHNATDMVDFSAVRGLAFIGNDLFVHVERDGSNARIEVTLNFSDDGGKKHVLLYAHDGGHTNALPQQDDFFDRDSAIGVPEAVRGLSVDRAASFASLPYPKAKQRIGLEGVEFNASIPGVVDAGRNVSTDTTVSVLQFPVAVLGRFGNATLNEFRLRVWNR